VLDGTGTELRAAQDEIAGHYLDERH